MGLDFHIGVTDRTGLKNIGPSRVYCEREKNSQNECQADVYNLLQPGRDRFWRPRDPVAGRRIGAIAGRKNTFR